VLHLEIQNPGVARIFGIAYTTQDNAMDGIIVKQDSPIESLTGLAGKRVGLFPGTTATNLLRALLEREGVDTSSTTFVPLPPPAQVGALTSGSIDALYSYEPVTTIAMVKGGFRAIYGSVFNSFQDPNPIGVALISRRFEREHPKLAKRMIEALLDGAQFVVDQPSDARKLLTKFLKIPPPVADQVHLIGLDAVVEKDAESLQKFIDILHEIGELPSTLDAKRLVAPGE
jgi:ABC-type nitrate/sulfonate/bicarbonate transport system substrate-binding protein